MSERPLIVVRPHPTISPQEARDARARSWKFIFDTHREKAARQDNAKTKQKKFERKGRRPA